MIEPLLRVVGIGRFIISRLVARIAISGRAGVSGGVAFRAGLPNVCPGQGVASGGVIPIGGSPTGRRMARRTDLTETSQTVIGIL